MNARSNWIGNVVTLLLSLMIVMDGALFLYVRAAVSHVNTEDLGLLYRFAEKHGAALPPDGFTANGVKAVPKPQSGWAVRYAAKRCEYCRKDEFLWGSLSAQLQHLGYKVIVLVPTANDEYPKDAATPAGAQQVAYVNMEWIKQFRLTGTPTLLIFDQKQGLIWAHQGVLDPGDPSSALRAIKFWQGRSK